MRSRKTQFCFTVLLIGLFLTIASLPAQAQSSVIDDFEDGETGDWVFFGTPTSGGGGGPADDRPQEGNFYFSTGWGGDPAASSFYGGAFKNFADTSQPTLPADPWFNVYVYNQSDATSDGYTLEITLREDTDGDGYAEGTDDSFRLDTVFTSADYNDQWTLVSTPLSGLTNLNTGGDGTFNGDVDEIVIVIAGVTGASGATVEVDFDNFVLSAGGPIEPPAPPASPIIDDFEDGDVSDWGFFGGNNAGGAGGAAADRPVEGNFYFSSGWGGEGTDSGFYGGAFKNFADEAQPALPADPWFNVYVLNQSDATSDGYTLEVTIREDTDGDGYAEGTDDSFRLDTVFTSADYNDVWTLISAPLSDFANLNTGGDGTFNGDVDEVVIVISNVTGADGATIELDFDLFTLSSGGPIDPVDPPVEPSNIVEDFENGLPSGSDGELLVGYFTFVDGSGNTSIGINTTQAPPEPVPGSVDGNTVISTTVEVDAFAGFVSNFTNEAADTWLSQDWSSYEGVRFWMYGQNSGTATFIDVIDNRTPGSTVDDGERFSVEIVDNFSGWQLIELPFSSFVRKEIGNGAPNDGFGLTQIWGWAFGTLGTGGETVTYYLDDLELYGEAAIPDLAVTFSVTNNFIEEGTTGDIAIKLNRPMNSDDPAQVSVDYFTEPGVATPGREYTPATGTLTFVNGGPSELTFPIETFDDSKFEGDERIILRLNNFVDVVPGFAIQASAFIQENDPFDPNIKDDFENGVFQWESTDDLVLSNPEVERANETFADQAAEDLAEIEWDLFETILQVDPVEVPVDADLQASFVIAPSLVDQTTPSFGRDFPLDEDWSNGDAVTFWYYGSNTGEKVTFNLKENRAPDPGPDGWGLVWSEEFNEPEGTVPNPDYWTYEIGDVTPDGKNGWGNDERQYYTDDPANAATDGEGNMVLTLQEADGSLDCYYGSCEYTSARLISWRKAEFAYGRIESRILVPQGAGIWPAFWSLGTDIDVVQWPQTGEIDFMEFVGRLPNEIFGTIHGPGYSGGQSYGNIYDFGEPVYNDYHTFTVEWEPDFIVWYVDGIKYHEARPSDVAPNEWVFNDPVFLLLNVAIGGNFGGTIDPNIELPQSMKVDYIRIYQGPDTAERFETTFTDDFTGWQKITIPYDSFTRSAEQPDGAPNDGLSMESIWGYSYDIPVGVGTKIDQIEVQPIPPPSELVVTTLADDGEGSLRDAVGRIGPDGLITFDPELAGGTISLTSGQLVLPVSMTIDGSTAPGLTVSGSNSSRVMQIAAGAAVNINDMTMTDGAGLGTGGGILNFGDLTLTDVVVTNNVESSTGAADFQLGGGGIYNGENASLTMIRGEVSDNSTLGQPGGGLYGFFNSTITVKDSTVSGNVSGDVAGGFRTLGDLNLSNVTVSGNTSTGWHGGGIFSTDGNVTIVNSTIVDNISPDGTAGGLMVATFGNPVNVTVQNTIIANNTTRGCQVEGNETAAVLTSLGNNLFTDDSCNNITSDIVTADALLGPLQANGGPTLTHLPLDGSPAIDAADDTVCAADPVNGFDQRGVARPQAESCDIGAVEAEEMVAANLLGSVALVGRGDEPNSRWIVDLTVEIYPSDPQASVGEYSVTTDETGQFTAAGIPAGTYYVAVKAPFSLKNVEEVTLEEGDNVVDFGELKVGDIVPDNKVTLIDFSTLATTFNLSEADDGYDGRADLNGDGMVTSLDFSLLVMYFNTAGDEVVIPQ
ncbi:MAG: family 16 glycosylhydrolase [Chloroflexota bacterium]